MEQWELWVLLIQRCWFPWHFRVKVEGHLARGVEPGVLSSCVCQGAGFTAEQVAHGTFLVVPHCTGLYISVFLLLVVFGKFVEDDGDQKGHHQDDTENACPGNDLPKQGDRLSVSIDHGDHADHGPPPADGDTDEAGHVIIFLHGVDKHREDGNNYRQEEM
jgi:hypothetical protein